MFLYFLHYNTNNDNDIYEISYSYYVAAGGGPVPRLDLWVVGAHVLEN